MNIIKAEIKTEALSASSDAKAEVARLRELTAEVVQVTNAEEQSWAVRRAREAKLYLDQIEDDRTKAKAPVLTIGKRIDAIAKELRADLESEIERIGKLVTTFQRQEAERVAEAERQRSAAIQKAIADENAAKALQAEAEARVTQDDASLSDAEQAVLAEELTKQATDAVYDEMLKPKPEATRSPGMVNRKPLCYEVEDIAALYAARPDLVNLEPNRAAIRDAIFEGCQIPGLKVWRAQEVSFR